MTRSNLWALIIGLFVVGGAVGGGVVWRQNHPDAPAQLSRLVEPLVPKITEKLAPPPAASPKPEPANPEAAKSEAAKSEAAKSEAAKSGAAKSGAAKSGADKSDSSQLAARGAPPQFDVVRVEPSGDAVFAGKGKPDAKVALVEGGKVVAETKADPAGNFVMLPPALKPGAHDLSLQQSEDGKSAAPSKQNVAISIPKQPNGQVVVALAEPGKPTKLLSAPPKAPAPATTNAPPPAAQKPAGANVAVAKPETAVAPPAAVAPKGPDLAFRTVELEAGNGFFATGVATPGTKIELYLNGAHIAEVTAGNDGQWSVTIKKGLTGGHYGVRADAIGADRKVVARAEVPFDVPVAMGAPMKAPPGPEKVAPSEAQKLAEAQKAAEAVKAAEAKAAAARQAAEAKQAEEAQKAIAAEQAAEALRVAEAKAAEARKAAETQKAAAAKAAAAQQVADMAKAAELRAVAAKKAAEAEKAAAAQKIAAERLAAEAEKVAEAKRVAAQAPPNPSTLAELKSQSLAGPPKGDIQPAVPAPRPDIAAAAKATAQAAPGKAPPTLAMAPPANINGKTTGPDAVPAPTPPAGASAPQAAPAKMAVSPPKPAAAPPVIASTKPAIAPPKRAEVAVAVGAKPAPATAAGTDEAVPFAAQEPKQGPAPGQGGDAANAVIQEVETALVVPGDNLWNISRAKLGNATRYTQIYAANVSQIRNPDLIYPGQVFVMPQ